MADVKTSVEYKITIGDKSLLLDRQKFEFLDKINELDNIKEAANLSRIPYGTALNYIHKFESSLGLAVVDTKKGGSGGGGSSTLTEEGKKILRECKKINAIMEIHRETNELELEVVDIDKDKGIMKIQKNSIVISIPLNNAYDIGDRIVALISYDNIFLMREPKKSSVRNVFKGRIVELSFIDDMIRVQVDVDGLIFCSDITVSSFEELGLNIGDYIYIGFKALAIATLKL